MLDLMFSGGFTFDTLNALIAQLEAADGPLVAMRPHKNATILTFDDKAPKPTKHATLHPSTAPAPSGATRVCAGHITVAGEQMECTAWRVGG